MSKEKKEEHKSKPWYLQKTLYVTALSIVLYILKHYGIISEIPDEFTIGVGVAAALNIILRIITWIFFRILASKKE